VLVPERPQREPQVTRSTARTRRAVPVLATTVLCLAALGLSPAVATATVSRQVVPLKTTHGSASVACAGSLLKLYESALGPAFKRATGDAFGGPPCAGSLALASEILSNEISCGVFLSIGSKAIKELFPAHRAKFAMAVAADPLVIGYSRKSRYFAQLNAIRTGKEPLSDLFKLFTSPGFRLGRTDPTQDPQGIFFILMTDLAQRVLDLPPGEAARALGITPSIPYGTSSQMLAEDALPTDVAEGVVDAGSEYLPEAKQYGLDYVTLPPKLDFASPVESSLYSTVGLDVGGAEQQGEVISLTMGLVEPKRGTSVSAADQRADDAFAAFLLSSTGRSILARVGYSLEAPVLHLAPGVTRAGAALPSDVLSAYRALGGSISTS
jgi:molybdate/tungstate transport system substrate-binding protein